MLLARRVGASCSLRADRRSRSREALEGLCATYWRPINGFIRRRGHDAEAARDLTQGFFAGFLQQRAVEDLDPSRGRFRSYLPACVKHFLANEKEREGAQKRGGGTQLFSLSNDSDSDLVFEPADPRTPEAIYEHN